MIWFDFIPPTKSPDSIVPGIIGGVRNEKNPQGLWITCVATPLFMGIEGYPLECSPPGNKAPKEVMVNTALIRPSFQAGVCGLGTLKFPWFMVNVGWHLFSKEWHSWPRICRERGHRYLFWGQGGVGRRRSSKGLCLQLRVVIYAKSRCRHVIFSEQKIIMEIH